MEKQLNFVLQLSLKELTLRKIVINLWTAADVLASIANVEIEEIPGDSHRELMRFRKYRNEEEWRETVENEVKAKISELVLPKTLKKRMVEIVTPIGLQIRDWEILMEAYLSNSRNELYIHFLEQLCWTYTGAVDYQKTAERLVQLETIHVRTRFGLACLYCLVDILPILWEELPENCRRRFCNETCTSPFLGEQMQFYWAFVLKGEEYKIDRILTNSNPRTTTFFQYALERSACEGNRTLTEYFLQKLTKEERNISLVSSACAVAETRSKSYAFGVPYDFTKDNLCDVLCYLLSVMTSEQQMEVFKRLHAAVLICFLDWPWQDLFSDVADVIWSVIPESVYDPLANAICKKIRSTGYYFPNLIQNLALRSSRNFSRIFVLEFLVIFPEFSYSEDSVTIKVLFRSIDIEGRRQFVSSYRFFDFVKGLILREKWDLVELGLRELALSKTHRKEMHSFANLYIPSVFEGEERTLKTRRLKRCLELLDDAD